MKREGAMTSAISQTRTAIAEAATIADDLAAPSRVEADQQKAGKDFEALFLRQTLESILPESDNAIFGGGTAGGMWRSMLADRVSGVLAERGVLGISEMLTESKKEK